MARFVVSALFLLSIWMPFPTQVRSQTELGPGRTAEASSADPMSTHAQEELDRRVVAIEGRIVDLQNRIATLPTSIQSHGSDGAALFLFGAFCALWAQNTNRNPWLWFFLGLFFNVITVIVLLAKNSEDRHRRPRKAETSFLDE